MLKLLVNRDSKPWPDSRYTNPTMAKWELQVTVSGLGQAEAADFFASHERSDKSFLLRRCPELIDWPINFHKNIISCA